MLCPEPKPNCYPIRTVSHLIHIPKCYLSSTPIYIPALLTHGHAWGWIQAEPLGAIASLLRQHE
jgi:hypothetical protein